MTRGFAATADLAAPNAVFNALGGLLSEHGAFCLPALSFPSKDICYARSGQSLVDGELAEAARLGMGKKVERR